MWLSQWQRRALLEPRDAFFGLYVNLSLQAAEFERLLYGMIPKHHMQDHLVRICCETGLNPCSFWCFQDEDAMRLCMELHSTQSRVPWTDFVSTAGVCSFLLRGHLMPH